MIKKSVERKGVVGVSGKSGLTLLSVHKLLLSKNEKEKENMLIFLDKHSIKPLFRVDGSDSISWFFEKKERDGFDEKAFSEHFKGEFNLDEVEIHNSIVMLGLVGTDLDEKMQFIDALLELKENGIKVYSISYGGSRGTFLIAVDEKNMEEALNLISEKLFG